MKTLIKRSLQPTVTRLSTAIGAFLAGSGMATEHVAAIEAAIILLAGFGVDVGLRYAMKRGQK